MHQVLTKDGRAFNVQSFVKIGDRCLDMEQLNEEQRNYIATKLNAQGLNAAYAGEFIFEGEGLRPFGEVFPEFATN